MEQKYQELIYKKEENDMAHKQKIAEQLDEIQAEEEELAEMEAEATMNIKESRRLDIELAAMKRKGFYMFDTINENPSA